MKRQSVLKKFIPILKDNDIIVISGKGLISDMFHLDDSRMFYFEKLGMSLSFSLGLAMSTNKRVFVFCEDGELLRNYDIVSQLGVSACVNLFIVVLSCGRYSDSGGQPNIYLSLNSPKGSLFNLGMVVFDLTSFFKNKMTIKEVDNIIERIRGPMVIMMITKYGNQKGTKFGQNDIKIMDRFREFVSDVSLGSSLYIP